MTKQVINVGATANDKKGDSLRAAFQKVNANFTELYTSLGLDVAPLNLGAFEFTGSVMSTTDSSAITIDQAVTVSSNLSVGGDILPQTANGGDLGSASMPWRSLYVSNNTIFIGGTAVGVDANGNLTTNGTIVGGGGNEFNQSLNTGDSVTFNSVGATTVNVSQINGTNPGDELVIQANNNNWNFGADGNLTLPSGFITSNQVTGVNLRSGYDVHIISNHMDVDYEWILDSYGDLTIPGGIKSESAINIDINLSDSTLRRWQFGENGDLTLPAGGDIKNSSGTSVLSAVQGEYIYEFDGVNTDLTITDLNFNLLYCDPVDGYLGSDTHNVNLPAGTPGQRLVVVSISSNCTLTVNGAAQVTAFSGPAEFIYSPTDGSWIPLYGTV